MKKNCEMEYKMPTGKYYDDLAKLFKKLRNDPRYHMARSCVHCNDYADSFNRWTNTYCHALQKTIASTGCDELDLCIGCEMYERRVKK